MKKIPFKNGTKTNNAYVTINGTNHDVTDAVYTGETPLSAENLNQMQENIEQSTIAISSTEPTTTEKVWLRKTKNLFNYKTAEYLNLYIDGATLTLKKSATEIHNTAYIRCKPNTTYTFSKQAGKSFRIGTSTNKPAAGVIVNQTQANHSATTQTITTGENDNFLIFTCFSDYDDQTITYLQMYSTVQVELGTTSSAYENHVEDKILIKNANGNYEKFSETVSVDSKEPNTGVWFRKTKNVFNFNSIIPNYISKCSQPANINADYTNKKFTITNWNNNSYFPRIWPDLEVLSGLGYINLLTNTTYTLTLNSSNIDYLNVQIYYLDTTTNTYKMLKEAAKSEEITFTTNEFKKWIIRFCSIGASGSTLTISKIQLELGSATAYGEYVEDKIFTKNAVGIFEEINPIEEIPLDLLTLQDGVSIINSNNFPSKIIKQGNTVHMKLWLTIPLLSSTATSSILTFPQGIRPRYGVLPLSAYLARYDGWGFGQAVMAKLDGNGALTARAGTEPDSELTTLVINAVCYIAN